jgi:hypothetical protein
MILSWQIAKRRIARKETPGVIASWSLVLMDGALLLVVMALLWAPITAWLTALLAPWAFYAALFVIFFVPIQAVLINAAIWAVFSRSQDNDTPNT